MAGLQMSDTEAGASPEGARMVERGVYLSEASRRLAEQRRGAVHRRRLRAPELQAGREQVRRLDSAIRRHLDDRLAVAAEPQQQAVEDALREALSALDEL